MFDCVFCSSAAPELSHGDPGEGPRDQGAGGESGVLGSRGESSSLFPLVIIFYGFSVESRTMGSKLKIQLSLISTEKWMTPLSVWFVTLIAVM